ncbi:MAG: hypothetical protein HY269_08290 [Deltaproteobacteria bacterium]|nr:hypothetical protein [Deltaproteobacteria bacterium]
MGKTFEYSGSLDTGLIVRFKTSELRIGPKIIAIIRAEIEKRSPVKMGANRKPLVADSIGETLYETHHMSPQLMSYVLLLLMEEGFCSVSSGRPFVIYRDHTGTT